MSTVPLVVVAAAALACPAHAWWCMRRGRGAVRPPAQMRSSVDDAVTQRNQRAARLGASRDDENADGGAGEDYAVRP